MNDGGLGQRVRFLRRQRKMSLGRLAASTGLTKSYLSKVERGVSVPSISTAMKVAAAFDVRVGQLFGEAASDDSICVVRRNERPRFMRNGSGAGYNYESIAAKRAYKSMEPFVMRPPAAFEGTAFFTHTGEELIYVLAGRMEVEFVDRKVQLGAGDAIYFDAHVPHRSRSLGKKLAEALVVVTSS